MYGLAGSGQRAERTPLLRSSDDDAKTSSHPPPPSPPARHSTFLSPTAASRAVHAPPLRQAPPTSPPPARAVQRNEAVRRNLLSFMSSLHLIHLTLCVTFTFLLPQLVAIVVVLALHWDPSACDQPLHFWAVGYALRLAISLFIALIPFLPSPPATSPRSGGRPLHHRLLSLIPALFLSDAMTELLQIFSFSWFILGNYYVFHSTSCATSAPAVFQLVSTLLLLNCALIFLPLFLFLLFCPIFYLCTPFLLWIVATLLEMVRERRGLSPQALESMPSLVWGQGIGGVGGGLGGGGEAGSGVRGVGSVVGDVGDEGWLPSECSICLTAFAPGDKCRQLQCHPSHIFHLECVDEWLRLNAACPLCRTPIIRPQGDEDDAAPSGDEMV